MDDLQRKSPTSMRIQKSDAVTFDPNLISFEFLPHLLLTLNKSYSLPFTLSLTLQPLSPLDGGDEIW